MSTDKRTSYKKNKKCYRMQDQIRILKKDLKEAHEQSAAHKAAATPANALAAVPTPAIAVAQPPPPAPAPACHLYQEYNDDPPFYCPPRRQMDRQPPRCFLCGEGHFVSNCRARPVLQRLLRQQASASARGPPWGQILELPQSEDDSQAHPNVPVRGVTWGQGDPCWVRGRTTHHWPTQSRGHPSLRPRRHRRFSDLHGILGVVAIPRPMGSLEAFWGGRPRCPRQTSPDRGEDPTP